MPLLREPIYAKGYATFQALDPNNEEFIFQFYGNTLSLKVRNDSRPPAEVNLRRGVGIAVSGVACAANTQAA